MIAKKKLLARDLHLEREKSRHFKNIQIHSFVNCDQYFLLKNHLKASQNKLIT